jgi:hypothetical protein
MAERSGGHVVERHECSLWLRTRLVGLATGLLSGELELCPHLRPDDLGIAALWDSEFVACGRCSGRFFRLTGDDDKRCDRCGIVDQVVHPSIVVDSNMLVMLGLCPACHRRELAA